MDNTGFGFHHYFVSAQYLENKLTEFYQICSICIGRVSPNSIYAFILTRSRLELLPVIFHKFLALDWCQNSISALYLDNKWTEFDLSICVHWYWNANCLNLCAWFFTNLQQSTHTTDGTTRKRHKILTATWQQEHKVKQPALSSSFWRNIMWACKSILA